MISGVNKNILRKLHKFADNEISFSEMKEMVLDKYSPIKIYTRRLDGSRYIGNMFTVEGPSGNVDYNYAAKGYMIVYNSDAVGFRTIVFKNVYKIEKDNQTYLVR